jgi:hypothetical protein
MSQEETHQTNSGIEIALPDLGKCREEYGSEKEKEGTQRRVATETAPIVQSRALSYSA